MSLLDDILGRYLGGKADPAQTEQDFHHVAQSVPTSVLGQGVAAALNSPQTASAGELVGKMFDASNPEQRAAMLNQLAAALGPNAQNILGGILGSAAAGATVTAQQASQVNPQQVQDAVTKAQQASPDIIGSLGNFYAQHTGLVKTLGSAALAIALAKISRHV